ncbi:MAG: hypothetical protein WBA76_11490 [Phormidesmis sp.]
MNNHTHYINTDLDLSSAEDLTELATALETAGLLVLYSARCEDGLWLAIFEAGEQYAEPEASIAEILTIVESLPPNLRAIWASCIYREFNIGYDCKDRPRMFNQTLSSQLLTRLSAADAALRITLYPGDKFCSGMS